jgi:small nuclear ribonucleoprotein (snRNP)-like protein
VIVVLSMLVAVAACGAAGLYAWRSSRSGLLVERTRRRVLVTLKSGEAFSGVLFAVDREAIVLREAVAVGYGQRSENVPVEGEALILRSDIAYMQLP